MAGTLTQFGAVSLGVAVPLLGAAEAQLSATVALAKPAISGNAAGQASVVTRLQLSPGSATLAAEVEAELAATLQTTQKLQARLAAGLSGPSANLQLAGAVTLLAELNAKLAALDAALSYALGLGSLGATAGLFGYAYEGTADSMGSAIGAATSGGLPGGGPSDTVRALLLATSSSATWGAMGQVLKVG